MSWVPDQSLRSASPARRFGCPCDARGSGSAAPIYQFARFGLSPVGFVRPGSHHRCYPDLSGLCAALAEAGELLEASEESTRLVCWNLQRDIGMTCGGEMTLLFERVAAKPPWHLVIFGAGHIVQALVPVLLPLSCRIDVIDTRADWLVRLPAATNLTTHHVDSFEDGIELVTGQSFVLSITKGHASDVPVLRCVLAKHPGIPFLGVIGSASKRAALLRDLRAEGLNEDLLGKITCPLGLPVGGNDPHEIAISIAAQLLERRSGSQA